MLEAQNTLFFRLTPIAAALVALSAPASAATITWGGGTGDWYSTITPGGWADDNVPDITDIAVINSGTINGIDTHVTVAGLGQNGGTLSGSGSLTTSVLNWLSGTQTGNGITTVSGDAIIGSETYDLQYLGSSSSSGRTLNLNGDSSFQNAELYMGGGSVINNNGTLTSKGTHNGIYSNGAVGTFNNAGSFVQDATYSTMMMLTFNNTGSVNVQSGTLDLTGGTSTGSFTTQSGQTLQFGYANETYNLIAGSLSNAGNMLFSGTVNLDSDAVIYSGNGNVKVFGTFNINGTGNLTASNVSQFGGTISGSFITSELDWRGGTQTGGGTTTVNGAAMLGFGYPNYSDPNYSPEETPGLYLGSSSSNGRTLNLNGDTSFQSNALYLSDSTVNNNGTFTSKGYEYYSFGIYGGGIYSKGGTTGNTFNNAGSFVQDVSGNVDYRKITTIGVAFNNTGSVNVKSGILQLDNLSNYDRTTQTLSGGSYEVQGGQTLAINLGTSTNRILTNSADITLNGTNARILHTSGSNNALSALATNTTVGSLTLLNGAALSTGAFANAGAVTVGNSSSFASTGNYVQSAGSTVVHGDLSAGLVDIRGGSLFGNGTITGNLTNAGLVNPGASPGTLTVLGNFTQLADGILISEIAGITQGISYDWLKISGTSSLAGTLDIYFTAGYLPNAGDSYTLLSYGGWDQTMFDEVRVNGLDDLARYSILYSDTGVALSIVAVPEPSAYALLLAGLGFIGFMARRKRQQA